MDGRKSACVITVQSRLHLTLLAMHSGEYRSNGGIGFAISAPTCELTTVGSPRFSINDARSRPLSTEELNRLLVTLEIERERQRFASAVDISISGAMPTHSGFGSSTAIALACIEALHRANDSVPTASNIVSASGRGGTSGIGVHTYFSGGCVLDLGRPAGSHALAPSHKLSNTSPPLLVDQLQMPDWDVGICIPRSIECKTQAEEEAFFARTCPVPSLAVYETLYHVMFGLYAAIRERDWKTFCKALRAVQECYWKKAEREEYGRPLIDVERSLYSCGASVVSMSSLGPVLFFLADDVADVTNRMQSARSDCDYMLTQPSNHGRTIRQ